MAYRLVVTGLSLLQLLGAHIKVCNHLLLPLTFCGQVPLGNDQLSLHQEGKLMTSFFIACFCPVDQDIFYNIIGELQTETLALYSLTLQLEETHLTQYLIGFLVRGRTACMTTAAAACPDSSSCNSSLRTR